MTAGNLPGGPMCWGDVVYPSPPCSAPPGWGTFAAPPGFCPVQQAWVNTLPSYLPSYELGPAEYEQFSGYTEEAMRWDFEPMYAPVNRVTEKPLFSKVLVTESGKKKPPSKDLVKESGKKVPPCEARKYKARESERQERKQSTDLAPEIDESHSTREPCSNNEPCSTVSKEIGSMAIEAKKYKLCASKRGAYKQTPVRFKRPSEKLPAHAIDESCSTHEPCSTVSEKVVSKEIEVNEPDWADIHEQIKLSPEEKKSHVQALIDSMKPDDLEKLVQKFGGNVATMWAFIARITNRAAFDKRRKPIKHSVTVCDFWARYCEQPKQGTEQPQQRTPQVADNGLEKPCECNFWNDIVCQQNLAQRAEIFALLQPAKGEPPPENVAALCSEFETPLRDEHKKSQIKAFIEHDDRLLDMVETCIGKDKTLGTFIERQTTQAKNNERQTPVLHSPLVCTFWKIFYKEKFVNDPGVRICNCDFWNDYLREKIEGAEFSPGHPESNTQKGKAIGEV